MQFCVGGFVFGDFSKNLFYVCFTCVFYNELGFGIEPYTIQTPNFHPKKLYLNIAYDIFWPWQLTNNQHGGLANVTHL